MQPFNPFAALTRFATGTITRWVTIGIWGAAIIVLTLTAPKLADLYDNNGQATAGTTESVRAAALLQEAFPAKNPKAVPAILVFTDPHGLTSSDLQVVDRVTCWLLPDDQRAALSCAADATTLQRPRGIDAVVAPLTVPQAKAQLLSADGTTMTVVASVATVDGTPTKSVSVIRDYFKEVAKTSGLTMHLTGPAGIATDLTAVFANINVTILLSTVALVLLLLILIYRSPILAILPILAVGLVLQVIDPLTALLVKAGIFTANAQATGIRDVLIFGAGSDYVIFLIARYREELEREPDRLLALRRATLGVSEAITSSAGTVVLSLLTLLLTVISFYKPLGPILAIAIAFMLLAGLTLVPACLSILGNAAFWPSIPRYHPDSAALAEKGFWPAIARVVTKRPILALVGSVVVLGVFALGNIGVKEDYNFLTGLRGPTDSAAGSKVLAAHFPAGTLAPFTIVLHLTNGGDAYQQLAAIDALNARVAADSAVAKVTGPTRPDGNAPAIAPASLQEQFAQLPAQLKTSLRSGSGASSPPTTVATAPGGPPAGVGGPDPQGVIGRYAQTVQYISADFATVQLTVTLKGDPYAAEALDAMAGVRARARSAAKDAGLGPEIATVQLAGITPSLAETRTANEHDKAIVIPLVLVLVALVLGLLLRSLIAPLYLLAAVSLNYAGALGVSSFLFTKIQGDDGLGYTVPLYTFIFLVALGADYTIFLMSRVREEAAMHGPTVGTRIALSRTGGVITSAGLLLAGTFSVLATLPLRDLYQLGVTVGIGILLDTFVVRGFLVPATVVLLKNLNWWPGKLRPVGHQA